MVGLVGHGHNGANARRGDGMPVHALANWQKDLVRLGTKNGAFSCFATLVTPSGGSRMGGGAVMWVRIRGLGFVQ